jgi:hypothetical protein
MTAGLCAGFQIGLELWDISASAIVVVAAAHDEAATSLTGYFYAFFALGCLALIITVTAQLQLISRKRGQRRLRKLAIGSTADESSEGRFEEVCCEIMDVPSSLLLGICQVRRCMPLLICGPESTGASGLAYGLS